MQDRYTKSILVYKCTIARVYFNIRPLSELRPRNQFVSMYGALLSNLLQIDAEIYWSIFFLFFFFATVNSIRRKTAKGCLNTDERLNVSDENVSAACDYDMTWLWLYRHTLVWHQSVIEASIHPSIECLTVLEQPDDCPTLTVSKLCDDQK